MKSSEEEKNIFVMNDNKHKLWLLSVLLNNQ